MKDVPCISVLMVTYNAEKTISKAIDSVRKLKRDGVFFYIIDGDSTDNTCLIIKRNIDIIDGFVSEKDNGIYDAMNKAWSMAANNSYNIFLGADDELKYLPTQDFLLKSTSDCVELIYGNVLIGNKLFSSELSRKIRYRNTMHHQGMFLLKRAIPNAPFNTKYKVFSDWDLNCKLWRSGIKYLNIGTTICKAGTGGVSTEYRPKEVYAIIKSNFGVIFGVLAVLYHRFF